MKSRSRYRTTRGMSLLEMLVVVAITLTVAALALPNVTNAMANVRLRAAANDVAGLLQQGHFRAIRDNTFYTVRTATSGGARLVYVDTTPTHDGTTWSSAFPTVQLSGNVTRVTSGYPDTTSMALGFTPQAATSLPTFSARGTPCLISGNICVNSASAGYQIFLTDTRSSGPNGWAAITVSPAGRTRVWLWNGSKWR